MSSQSSQNVSPVLTAELADELLQFDAECIRKMKEYKQTSEFEQEGGFWKFSGRSRTELPVIRLLANPETKTFDNSHAFSQKKRPLKNIILVVQYQNDVLTDFWFTHIDHTQSHCKNNFADHGGVPTITTSARGLIIYDHDIGPLLRTGFVSQTYRDGAETQVENHYVVIQEMLAKLFLKQ
ncbi:MAG: hypothetical protein Terrestrivirus6_57 [Terrestrivirus sp.]|uniref:Uncharacterized protein n=1 Tax=Terrestrivirus sp. TaxID=2487775 RepID=A0A3G4ZR17_9VIRU|nr:MAG: hypothetical protein Terrestrivirus6_57 [Terrestrivirus sp.]